MSNSLSKRRSFLSQLGAGVTLAGAGFTLSAVPAAGQSASGAYSPKRHAEDGWMDSLPGSHRLVIDTTTPRGFAEGLAFAGNFLKASMDGYKLADHDSAIIIVARHFATPFAFKDPVWAKYGKVLPPFAAMDDPKTNQRPAFNLLNAPGYGLTLPNFGTTVDDVTKRGVHFAVCQMATGFFAGMFAKATGGTDSAVYAELTANLVDNSHLAAAGIIAVNRAQERGYTLASAG
jgi:intracellular sulfur oxidation DsrE/DsrF family protein